MHIAYPLAVLPVVGILLGRVFLGILGDGGAMVAAYVTIAGVLPYPSWLIVKGLIIGFYSNEKGVVVKSLILYFLSFIAMIALLP